MKDVLEVMRFLQKIFIKQDVIKEGCPKILWRDAEKDVSPIQEHQRRGMLRWLADCGSKGKHTAEAWLPEKMERFHNQLCGHETLPAVSVTLTDSATGLASDFLLKCPEELQ
ncbi:hypothetical protein NDU88_001193 [Pleurodeles waltl]|uniref:Uncharacterized protein n=1 Tax=Pleurodeles waltl TaxID=8319 RepID=A0AAV7U776_PLEWA|nr:hypothetical protein NDU88_001193 [Pleurodeles waltl]